VLRLHEGNDLADAGQHRRVERDQFVDQTRQPRRLAVAVAHLQPEAVAVNPAEFAQASTDRLLIWLHDPLACDPEEPHDRHRPLLRLRRERPRSRAAKRG